MADLQKIVYLTDAQYADLIANGSITVGTTTIVYSANDLYLTPSSGGNVPNGGTQGQALLKASSTDQDLVWGNVIKKTVLTPSISDNLKTLSSTDSGLDLAAYNAGYKKRWQFGLTGQNVKQALSCIIGEIALYQGYGDNKSLLSLVQIHGEAINAIGDYTDSIIGKGYTAPLMRMDNNDNLPGETFISAVSSYLYLYTKYDDINPNIPIRLDITLIK